MKKLIIADEDHEMRGLIEGILVTEFGNTVSIRQIDDGKQAVKVIESTQIDLAIVNWSLPELSKHELLAEIRKVKKPSELALVLMVVSPDSELIATLLENGASEVLNKPFERSHLLACIRSFIKTTSEEHPERLAWGDLALDTRTQDVYFKGERIRLTPSEFKLLRALVEQKGAALSRDQLIELVQGEGIAVIDRAVDTHVFALRKKLGACAEMVQTVRGSGYRIKEI